MISRSLRTILVALGIVVFSSTGFADETTPKVVVIPLNRSSSLQGLNLSGPQQNIKQSFLESAGWSICFSETYDVDKVTSLASLFNTCNKDELLLACRQVGGETFTVAAHAPRVDVIYDTGDNIDQTHAANGVAWYYNENRSMGFAPLGETVSKTSCDGSNSNGEYRMCIHLNPGLIIDGFRCGTTEYLNAGINDSDTWERVFMHR